MELNFVQSSEVFGKNTLAWETEFEATGDFNLHVERNKGGDILVYQRTAGSGYAIVEEFRGMDNKPAIDLDFTSVVYPKFVKIVSESQPTYATVTTDGEITEIKSQSKEVEITANGTMDITPDAGFSYLNSVKVKTNVPTSGEGGGSASTVEYLDLTGLATLQLSYYSTSSQELHLKMTMQGQEIAMVGPAAQLVSQGPSASSIYAKIDFDAPIIMVQGTMRQDTKVRDYILSKVSESELAAIPRITEEEFYTLDNGGVEIA